MTECGDPSFDLLPLPFGACRYHSLCSRRYINSLSIQYFPTLSTSNNYPFIMGKLVLFLLVGLVALSFAPKVAAFGAGKLKMITQRPANYQATSPLTHTLRTRLIVMETSKISLRLCSKLQAEVSYLEAASSPRST